MNYCKTAIIVFGILILNGCNKNSPTAVPEPVGTADVTVLFPNGGQTYHIGDTVQIKWKMSSKFSGSMVYLMLNDGGSPSLLNRTGKIPIPDTTFKWIILETDLQGSLPPQHATIAVNDSSDTTMVDQSDEKITIESHPL
jgi:hypothetical protein